MQRACYDDYDAEKEQHNVSRLRLLYTYQIEHLMHKKFRMILSNRLNHLSLENDYNDALSHHGTAQF